MPVVQRADWHGKPADLEDVFRLHKVTCDRQLLAVCRLRTHQFGWECRLVVGDELLRSQVCRSEQDIADCAEHWKAAMVAKGWR